MSIQFSILFLNGQCAVCQNFSSPGFWAGAGSVLAHGGKPGWAMAEGCPVAWRLESCPLWHEGRSPLSSSTVCGCSSKPSNGEHRCRLAGAATCSAEGQRQRGHVACHSTMPTYSPSVPPPWLSTRTGLPT